MLVKLRSRLNTLQPSILFLTLAILLGGFIRLAPVLNSTFPLNDGGLFYAMTQELVENGFKLPQFSTFNNLQIPFAYPPLGFYLSGGLYKITGWELLDIFRLLPAIFSILTIPAFYLIAKALLDEDVAVGLSVLIFSFIPIDFEWFLMGGGITRAPGFLFSLLALYFGYKSFVHGRWFNILLTAVFSSTAVLLHPEAAAHTAIGLLIFFIFKGRTKKGLLSAVVIVLGVLLMTCPWWINVFRDHGVSPIFAASRVGVDGIIKYLNLILFNFTGEYGLTSIALLAFAGIFYCIHKKQNLLPVWLLATFLIAQRGEIIALLAGITLSAALMKLGQTNFGKGRGENPKILSGILPKILFTILLFQWMFSGITIINEVSSRYTLTTSEISAMAWVKENTPVDSKFIILSGTHPLFDPNSEWFPALTNRQSISTIQGNEWISQVDFDELRNNSLSLQACILQDLDCLDEWDNYFGWEYDYIFLRKFTLIQNYGKIPTVGLSNDLSTSSRFYLVHETETILIYKVDETY